MRLACFYMPIEMGNNTAKENPVINRLSAWWVCLPGCLRDVKTTV
jgi:hypothetical protein